MKKLNNYPHLFFLTFVLATHCSRPMMSIPDELQDPDTDSAEVLGKSLSDARGDIKKTVLNCAVGSPNCPQNIALMAVVGQSTNINPAKQYFIKDPCTASFVRLKADPSSEIFALTAGHCIPKRIKVGAHCAEDITFVTAGGKRPVCDKVAFALSDPGDNVNTAHFDLALIRLKNTEGLVAFDLNKGGLKKAGAPHGVTMLAVDPASDWNQSMSGTTREKECFYLQNSFVLPTSRTPRAALFMNRDCGLRPGHSGAPLLDGGVVVGVQNDFIQFDPPIFTAGSLAIATSVACFDAHNLKATCDTTMPKLYRDKEGNLVHGEYLNFVRAIFLKGATTDDTFDADTLQLMKSVAGQEKSALTWQVPKGFRQGWVYKDLKKDSEYYIRIPFPRCASAALAKGNLGPYHVKVLIYGLKASRKVLGLQLEGHISDEDFELVNLGNGKFHLNTFLSPDGFLQFEVPVCRS